MVGSGDGVVVISGLGVGDGDSIGRFDDSGVGLGSMLGVTSGVGVGLAVGITKFGIKDWSHRGGIPF